MGVGKTTFTKAILRVLGVEDVITSPTFRHRKRIYRRQGQPYFTISTSIASRSWKKSTIWAMKTIFYSGNLCLLEWPELIEDILPENAVKVKSKKNKPMEHVWCRFNLNFPEATKPICKFNIIGRNKKI